MNTIKRIYFTSVIVSLAFFAACGDSESTDITTPDDSSETDITDSSNIDKDSSATGDSSATKDSSSVKDTVDNNDSIIIIHQIENYVIIYRYFPHTHGCPRLPIDCFMSFR